MLAGFLASKGEVLLCVDGAGVHASIETHEGDAGFGIAAQNSVFDGGGAAVGREERGVDIYDTAREEIQEVLGDDLTEGDEDAGGGLESRKIREDIAEASGLEDGEMVLLGELFDGRGREGTAAAAGGVGFGDNSSDMGTGLDESLKGGGTVGLGAEEDDAGGGGHVRHE